jgi:uncharacterized protein YhdP
VVVDLSYLDGEAPAREEAAPNGEAATDPPVEAPWLDGTFAFERVHVGFWPLESVAGKMRAVGAELRLLGVKARLADGELEAEGTLALDNPEEAPVELRLNHRGGDAAAVASILGLGKERLTGDLTASGTVEGSLRPDPRFSSTATIDLEVEITDGTLGKGPLTLTIARLASLQGWTGLFGRPLPFNKLASSPRIDHGTLHVEEFNLDGPELRILAAGKVELLEEGRPVELLVALLLFNPVDWVIGTVPVVGDWILGKDRNLVALYFRLEGPWASPDGSYVPPQTLRTAGGWTERIIVGGIRRLRDLLLPGGEKTEPN